MDKNRQKLTKLDKNGQTRQRLALVLLGQCARLRLTAQRFDCIIEKRRDKLRHKKSINEMTEIFVLYTVRARIDRPFE